MQYSDLANYLGGAVTNVQPLSIGPIVGHTTDTYVRLWGRGENPANMRCQGIAQLWSDNGTLLQSKWFRMLPHFDFTGIVDFDGLQADTHYKCKLGYIATQSTEDELGDANTVDLEKASLALVTTMPSSTSDELSFIFGSCRYMRNRNDDGRSDKAFRSIKAQIDLGTRTHCTLMIGDQIYSDMGGGESATTYDNFLSKYHNAFSTEHIKDLMSVCPTYMAMDDHEITNNWSMDKLYDGHDQDILRNQIIFDAALSTYDSYQLIHSPAFIRNGDKFLSDRPMHRFYNFSIGSSRFFVLDTRTERYIKLKMIIGEEQMNALKLWLLENREHLKFIVTAVPFFPDIPYFSASERWTGYLEQRKEILDFIQDNEVKRVVFLGGDVHRTLWSTLEAENNPEVRIHSIVSSAFYWWVIPSPPVIVWDKTGPLRGAKEYNVISSDGFIDEDNFTRVTRKGENLHIEVFHRKGKLLIDHVIEI